MSRAFKESAEEASGARFREVLAEVARAHRDEMDEEAELSDFSGPLRASTIFAFDAALHTSTGGGSHWDAALAWIEEQDEPNPTPEPLAAAPDTPKSILKELGPIEGLTIDELNRVRRLYMWRNHPDRRGEAYRESATRRVAIANMLLDRAEALLVGGRRA